MQDLAHRRRLLLLALALGAMSCGGRAVESEPSLPAASPPPRFGAGCADALPLPLGRSLLGTTHGGGQALRASCAPGDAPERVYEVRILERSELRVVLGADFDAVLSLRRDCGAEQGELECNDDFPRGESYQSRLSTVLDPGAYFVVVDGAGDEEGSFELFASVMPVGSVGEACATARLLPPGITVRGSTRGQADRFRAGCGRGAEAGEDVYRLEVASPSRLRVLQQTEYDGVLHLRAACDRPGTELACNDDFRGPHHSLLTARLDPGTYYLFSDGLSRIQEGTYSLRADLYPIHVGAEPPGERADSCRAAQQLPLSSGRASLDTLHLPSRERGSCGGEGAPEGLYAFALEERSRVWVRLADAEFNAVVYVRRQCQDAQSEVVCVSQLRRDRAQLAGMSSVRGLNTMLDPGLYWLFVDGVDAFDFGAAELDLDVQAEAPLRALCEAGIALGMNDVVEGETRAAPDRFRATCGDEARGPEDVYKLTVEHPARVKLELTSGYDAVLHLRRDCVSVQSEVACNDDDTHDRVARLSRELDPGEYWVMVDGLGPGDVGPYRLRVHSEDLPGSERDEP